MKWALIVCEIVALRTMMKNGIMLLYTAMAETVSGLTSRDFKS